MTYFENLGTIKSQKFLSKFTWEKKEYNCYAVEFVEHKGFFKINRSTEHEQALIGAKIFFNYCNQKGKITKYRVQTYVTLKEMKEPQRKKIQNSNYFGIVTELNLMQSNVEVQIKDRFLSMNLYSIKLDSEKDYLVYMQDVNLNRELLGKKIRYNKSKDGVIYNSRIVKK